jgi:hypothetical protein
MECRGLPSGTDFGTMMSPNSAPVKKAFPTLVAMA